MPATVEKKNVPANAMRFDAGRVQFADGEVVGQTNSAPIKMLGRSAEPINHWYWGKIIHDMAGFRTDHDKVPIDWSHDSTWEEGIGYLDNFTADKKGLNVEGMLVSIEPDDRAAKIMKKSAAGVPYQASIFFRPERLEQVPEGFSAEVNGYTVEGPAIIVREWALRGMAVCLYGADHRTNSQFSDGDEVAVEIFSMESEMTKSKSSETKSETKLTDDPANPETKLTDINPPVVVPTQQSEAPTIDDARTELKKFVAKFGAENGAKYFADNVSFADAMELHVGELQKQLTAKDAEIEAVNTKLKSIDRGESTPAKFNDGDKPEADKKANDKFAHLGDGLSRFAASLKLPGQPSNN
jgi:hypothetical protein